VPLPVHCSLWWNIEGGCKLSVRITGNFCTQIFSGGAKWGWCHVGGLTGHVIVQFHVLHLLWKEQFFFFLPVLSVTDWCKIVKKLLNCAHSLWKVMWLPSFIDGRNWAWDTGVTFVWFFEFLGFQRDFWSCKWCQITGAFCNQHTVLIFWTPSSDKAAHPRGMGASSFPILFSEQTVNIQLLNRITYWFQTVYHKTYVNPGLNNVP
jgi:hypothetical protein